MVIGTDYKGNSKSNYHTITFMTAPELIHSSISSLECLILSTGYQLIVRGHIIDPVNTDDFIVNTFVLVNTNDMFR